MLDFEMIFEENKGFIFRFLMKLCGNSELAEELTQDTFYRAYMNLSSVRDESRVPQWLCQIAKNTYYAWFNQQKKCGQLSEDEAESTPDIAELFEEKELGKRAFSCLHGLSEPYKEVFMLYTFSGLSLKSISEIFAKSESWARVTYYRAKQKILERLEK